MDGGPNTKYFESPETINALEGVKNWLQKNAKKVSKCFFILLLLFTPYIYYYHGAISIWFTH